MDITVLVKKLDQNSPITIPKFAFETDACADLESNAEVVIPPGEFRLVPTGLAFQIPVGYEMQVRPRSGLAAKYGVSILNSPGTVDSDYRGEVRIIIINLGREEFVVKQGDRIAQVAIRPVPKVNFVLVEELDSTIRGEKGFGSTGVSS